MDPRISTPARRIERAKPRMSTARRDVQVGSVRPEDLTGPARDIQLGAPVKRRRWGRDRINCRTCSRNAQACCQHARDGTEPPSQCCSIDCGFFVLRGLHGKSTREPPTTPTAGGPFCPARAAMCRSRFRRSQRDRGERGWEQHGYSESRAAPFNRRLDPRRGCSAPRGFSKL
jgi:hypothetical protein